ncbi:MAG: hypothetical protein CL840_17070 [Crocinitomicaceae bacterium]|nr:hypothetical protein [Crocinitomicaceae bacterium]|tara:strand:+ start:3129 stop:4031 length:903 start_codon:yes stop_codon:yes gene_type:complete
MKNNLLLVLALLFGIGGYSQLLESHKGFQNQGGNFFNSDFIKKNRIKTITGKISFKREMQPIRRNGTVEQYSFDRNGQLIERLKTFKMRGGQIDTTQDYFKYNDLEHLVSQTTYTLSGYNSVRYRYNENGNPTQESFFRGENKSPNSYELQKGQETLLKNEEFQYDVISDSSLKKVYLNSVGKPYKETIINTNRLGQKESELTRYYLTNKKASITYKYDLQGRLIKIIDYSNLLGVQTITYTYEYDEFDNLYSSKIYKNGKLTRSEEFIYFVQTFLLKAQLSKNESDNSIKIIQYSYEYY